MSAAIPHDTTKNISQQAHSLLVVVDGTLAIVGALLDSELLLIATFALLGLMVLVFAIPMMVPAKPTSMPDQLDGDSRTD